MFFYILGLEIKVMFSCTKKLAPESGVMTVHDISSSFLYNCNTKGQSVFYQELDFRILISAELGEFMASIKLHAHEIIDGLTSNQI